MCYEKICVMKKYVLSKNMCYEKICVMKNATDDCCDN